MENLNHSISLDEKRQTKTETKWGKVTLTFVQWKGEKGGT